MSEPAHLVTAEREQPLREAGLFVLVTYLVAAAVYLPLLASDRGWIDATLPPALQVVAILSPGIATLVVRLVDDGRDGVRTALRGLTAWQFGREWWAVTLGFPLVFVGVLTGGAVALGQSFSPEPVRLVSEAGAAILPVVLVTLVLSAGEELGWRGHLLPLLQARTTALRASLGVGVVWALWHVPVFYGAGVEGWALLFRLVSVPAGAVLYTWLFNNTGGSVLAVTVLHAGINLWGPLLAPSPTAGPALTVFVAENFLVAVALVAVFGGATLTRRRGFEDS